MSAQAPSVGKLATPLSATDQALALWTFVQKRASRFEVNHAVAALGQIEALSELELGNLARRL